MLLPAARELLDRHRSQGDTLLIITATNAVVTRPIADRLGVEQLLACEAECIDDTYTGRPRGIPSFREGKILRLEDWLKDKFGEGGFVKDEASTDLPKPKLNRNQRRRAAWIARRATQGQASK